MYQTLPLAKADALAEDDPSEPDPDQIQDASLVFIHGTQATASFAAELVVSLIRAAR